MNLLMALLTAMAVIATPQRYECNSNNIISIANKVSANKQDAVLVVRENIDLAGRKLSLPASVEIVVEGGSFKNGSIAGNNTTLSAGAYPIFEESVNISGTWVIDNAYAEWFGITGKSDDTKIIQKCLDLFFQCKLLNKTYNVTTLNIPDNAFLYGNAQGRYRMPTLYQLEAYKGDLITTGNKAYSGVALAGFRITGGREENTAIRIRVPNSRVEGVFCDEYFGNGITLDQRAWGTKIERCSVYGNMAAAKTRKTIGTAITVNTDGGLINIEKCDITYYQCGIDIEKGVCVAVRECNISECSQNLFKKTDACIKINGGESISIYDNYVENFSTGILLLSGKQISIQNNYINGLSVASFGIDVKGAIEGVEIKSNHIYMGYKSSWAVAVRSNKIDEKEVRVLHNKLDEKKLYKIRTAKTED